MNAAKTPTPDWDAVKDWDRSNAAIARDLGCSREAVRQRRQGVGITPPKAVVPKPPEDAELAEIVGWRIRLHRLRHGWTGDDLAGRVNDAAGRPSWSKPSISTLENGRPTGRGLTIPWLEIFAEALSVTPADLLLLPGQTVLEVPPRTGARARVGATLATVIGRNVALWRMARKLTHRELADLVVGASLTATRVREIEDADAGISLARLAALALALEVTPADLGRLPRQPALRPVETG